MPGMQGTLFFVQTDGIVNAEPYQGFHNRRQCDSAPRCCGLFMTSGTDLSPHEIDQGVVAHLQVS